MRTRPLNVQRSRPFSACCRLCSWCPVFARWWSSSTVCLRCMLSVVVVKVVVGHVPCRNVEELTRRGWDLSFHWVPSHGRDPAPGWRPPEGFSEARVRAINHRADRAANSACRRRVQGSGRQEFRAQGDRHASTSGCWPSGGKSRRSSSSLVSPTSLTLSDVSLCMQ